MILFMENNGAGTMIGLQEYMESWQEILKDDDHPVLSFDNEGHVDADMQHGDGLVDDDILDLGSVNESGGGSSAKVHGLDLHAYIPYDEDCF